MALTADIEVNQVMPGTGFGYPVKAGARIFGRALVGITAAGFAAPLGGDATIFVGIAVGGVDNRSGADGAEMVSVERDSRALPQKMTAADIGKPLMADDDDISKAATGSGKTKIGIVTGLTVIGGAVRGVVDLKL